MIRLLARFRRWVRRLLQDLIVIRVQSDIQIVPRASVPSDGPEPEQARLCVLCERHPRWGDTLTCLTCAEWLPPRCVEQVRQLGEADKWSEIPPLVQSWMDAAPNN